MIPTELWILIATDMPTRDLYNLSLCSKDIYHLIKGVLNIRRLMIKFVNKCAFSNLHYRSDNDPKLYIPTDVCISELSKLYIAGLYDHTPDIFIQPCCV